MCDCPALSLSLSLFCTAVLLLSSSGKQIFVRPALMKEPGHCCVVGFFGGTRGRPPSSYCPVSSARLAFCQPASVELCTLRGGGSSVTSRSVRVSCETSELALTVARAKVKVSTSHLRLPYPSPKTRDHSRAHVLQANLDLLSVLSVTS